MITIGTDCSGIEAPIEALKQLGIPFQHKWSCEIDKFARQSILANYEPEILYEDITKRDHSQLPDVDIYVCGFPCQSFSLMGKKLGTHDPRSNIMLHCIEVIKKKKPSVFILENVKNFKFIEKGKPYNFLIDSLTNVIDDDGEQIYNIYSDIYNTKDYGIPQNRARIYIIGIQRDIELQYYKKPHPLPIRPLENFILDKTVSTNLVKNSNIVKNLKLLLSKTNDLAIVTGDNFYYPLLHWCPTLTRHCSQFFINKLNRRILPKEALLLQGFSQEFNIVVSNSQIYKQAGNTMSVNVIKNIFKEILHSTFLQHMT
jgi:DNA (cytosine-5)-methyltransferase 1